jgi:hypothetical protein
MYRTKDEQLIYDLEQYYGAFQMEARNYQESFYEELIKVLLRGELVKNIRFPEDETGSILLKMEMELIDYLAESIVINGVYLTPCEIRRVQKHILPINHPFSYSGALWNNYKDKQIRDNLKKLKSYYRKLPGFKMPACPKNVVDYLKGLTNLHLERRK